MSLGNNKKDIKFHEDVEEFIPYAAHFDEETLITKNGELLQIIKLNGYAYESVENDKEKEKSLRNIIRLALQKNIKTDNFAIWVHTIRRQRDISSGGIYNNDFARDLNEKWQETNGWRTQFVNELYITIISEGDVFPIKDPRSFVNSLFKKAFEKDRRDKLLANTKKLTTITNAIISDLSSFGARKLSIFKRSGVYYSELMGFISKIMNLRQHDIPIQIANLSTILPTHTVSFQYSTVMVEGPTGRHFGAIFSVKGYREITEKELDRLIQLPVNLIISQSIDFVTKEKAYEEFADQKKIYELSGSEKMSLLSGIKDIFDKDNEQFGQTQITLTVLESSIKSLQKAVSEVVDTLRDMGVTFIREDLFLENCYWSMLPANFDFLKRKSFIPFSDFGGFASLHNFTTGKYRDNKWGNAITTLHTKQGLPYFFNFHVKDNGHSLIVDEQNSHGYLLKFLLAQSMKVSPKIYLLETDQSNLDFVSKLGGDSFLDIESFSNSINNKEQNILSLVVKKTPEELILALRQILNDLDNSRPTIIVISEELTKIENTDLNNLITDICQKLIEGNGIFIFKSDGTQTTIDTGIFTATLNDLIKTKIFLPRKEIGSDFKEIFSLKDREFKELKDLANSSDEFMLKRDGITTILKFDISGLGEKKGALI